MKLQLIENRLFSLEIKLTFTTVFDVCIKYFPKCRYIYIGQYNEYWLWFFLSHKSKRESLRKHGIIISVLPVWNSICPLFCTIYDVFSCLVVIHVITFQFNKSRTTSNNELMHQFYSPGILLDLMAIHHHHRSFIPRRFSHLIGIFQANSFQWTFYPGKIVAFAAFYCHNNVN